MGLIRWSVLHLIIDVFKACGGAAATTGKAGHAVQPLLCHKCIGLQQLRLATAETLRSCLLRNAGIGWVRLKLCTCLAASGPMCMCKLIAPACATLSALPAALRQAGRHQARQL